MSPSVCGRFATRREAELAVEHLVQEVGVQRTAVTVRAAGPENSAGTAPAGADVQSGHPGLEKHGDPKLAGSIEVRVSCADSTRPKVEAVLREMGGAVG